MDTDSPEFRPLDHTADVGFELIADSLEDLFTAAARALFAAVLGSDDDPRATVHAGEHETLEIECTAEDVVELLVAWLRELLWLHHDRRLIFETARFTRLDEHGLRAHVTMTVSAQPPVREIKGVTYHELIVQRSGPRLYARIILDV